MITPETPFGPAAFEERIERAILGGADAVQFRDKKLSDEEMTCLARRALRVTSVHGVPLIVNDRLAVAKASGADGVHLGQDDGSLRQAHALLGESAIFGRSTHSVRQIEDAQHEGFDYIGVGPVFGTPTKPGVEPVGLGLVEFAAKNARIPFVAIGGIDAGNAGLVMKAGARTVAVVRAVLGSADPYTASQNLKKAMKGS